MVVQYKLRAKEESPTKVHVSSIDPERSLIPEKVTQRTLTWNEHAIRALIVIALVIFLTLGLYFLNCGVTDVPEESPRPGNAPGEWDQRPDILQLQLDDMECTCTRRNTGYENPGATESPAATTTAAEEPATTAQVASTTPSFYQKFVNRHRQVYEQQTQ